MQPDPVVRLPGSKGRHSRGPPRFTPRRSRSAARPPARSDRSSPPAARGCRGVRSCPRRAGRLPVQGLREHPVLLTGPNSGRRLEGTLKNSRCPCGVWMPRHVQSPQRLKMKRSGHRMLASRLEKWPGWVLFMVPWKQLPVVNARDAFSSGHARGGPTIGAVSVAGWCDLD